MKLRFFSLLVIAAMLVSGALISSCGQSTPEVKTSNLPPQGLTIQGVVYGDTINGDRGEPLAGASVSLSGSGGVEDPSDTGTTRVVTSDADGAYKFEGVDSSVDSGYSLVTTKAGWQRTITNNIIFQPLDPPADNSIITQDVDMNGGPVLLSISPANQATIETTATFTLTFNEKIDPTTFVAKLNTQGPRTWAIGNTQNATVEWSADGKVATITPNGLDANTSYDLDINDVTTYDNAGYAIDFGGTGGGLKTTNFDYRTLATSAVAPTGLLLTVNTTTEINFADVNPTNRNVRLSWLAPASGSVTGYYIYVAPASTGPWAFLTTEYDNYCDEDNLSNNLDVDEIGDKLFGDNINWNATCVGRYPFITTPVYFRVVAFNGDGEGAYAQTSLRDTLGASLNGDDRNGSAIDATTLDNYTVTGGNMGANANKGFFVRFDEPMDESTLTTAANWTVWHQGATTEVAVASAAVEPIDNTTTAVVRLTFGVSLEGGVTFEVSTAGPKDLSGNYVLSSGNSGTL